jgi:hypothetical protein
MSISILQCCSGGYYLPLCGVCCSFLSGEFPNNQEEENHAQHLVYCLEDLESFWGELVRFDVLEWQVSSNYGASPPEFFKYPSKCGLCGEDKPIVQAIVDFKGGEK